MIKSHQPKISDLEDNEFEDHDADDQKQDTDDILSLNASISSEQVEERLKQLEEDEDDIYKSKYPGWLILIVVLLTGTAMNANFSVLSIALPILREEFNSTDEVVSWITIAPMLASTIITPLASKLADDYGRKKMWLLGFFINLISLIICGFSNNLIFLIFGRALSGIGQGLNAPAAFGLVASCYSPNERAQPIAVFTGAMTISPAIGILIGGLVVEYLSWRWLFWGPLPIVTLGFFFGILILKDQRPPARSVAFDTFGTFFLMSALFFFLISTSQLSSFGFLSWEILLGIGLIVLSFVGFLWAEKKAENPVIPSQISKDPVISFLLLGRFFSGFAYMGCFFLLPFLLEDVYNIKPAKVSWILCIRPLTFSISTVFSGRFVKKFPQYDIHVIICGTLILSLSIWMYNFFEWVNYFWLLVPLFLSGLGFGSATPINSLVLTNRVSNDNLSAISGLNNLTFQLSTPISFTILLQILTFFGGSKHPSAYFSSLITAGIISLIAVLMTIFSWFFLRVKEIKPFLEYNKVELKTLQSFIEDQNENFYEDDKNSDENSNEDFKKDNENLIEQDEKIDDNQKK